MRSTSRFRLAVMATVMLGLAACSGGEKPKGPPPSMVTVAQPLARQVTDWDEYVGRFEAIQDVELRARVSGNIDRVMFSDGQDVRKGQPLFIIDQRPYRAALMQAKAQQAKAAAALANANTELARAKNLLDVQAVSKEEYEQKLANKRSAAADLEAARAAVADAQLNLGFTVVRSPITGRASDRKASKGNYVAAGQTILTRVVSLDPIWFSFDGAESFYLKYLRQDSEGQRGSSRATPNPVDIKLADESSYNWHGRMDFVDNAIDPGSGTIRAHAVVSNPKGFLTPGMFGRARLLGSGSYKAMLIPDEAIQTDQTRKLVYVLGKENKVEPRPIETGPPAEGLRIVKSGLKPTDWVIINGITRLQPGQTVKPDKTVLKPRTQDKSPMSVPLSAPPAAEADASATAN